MAAASACSVGAPARRSWNWVADQNLSELGVQTKRSFRLAELLLGPPKKPHARCRQFRPPKPTRPGAGATPLGVAKALSLLARTRGLGESCVDSASGQIPMGLHPGSVSALGIVRAATSSTERPTPAATDRKTALRHTHTPPVTVLADTAHVCREGSAAGPGGLLFYFILFFCLAQEESTNVTGSEG